MTKAAPRAAPVSFMQATPPASETALRVRKPLAQARLAGRTPSPMRWEVIIQVLVLGLALGLGFTVGPGAALIVAAGAMVAVVAGLLLGQPGVSPRASQGLISEAEVAEDVEPRYERVLTSVWPWLLAGLFARLGIATLVNSSSLWLSFGPDAMGWEARGYLVLQTWTGPAGWYEDANLRTFFPIVNAVAVAIFGHARFPVSYLNCFAGVGVAILAGHFAYRIYGREVARRALLLVLFYPSLMLWSAMNIRDVWAHAAILVVLIAGLNVRERFAPISFAALLGSVLLLYFIRPYLLTLLTAAVLGSLIVVRKRQIPYAIVTFIGVGAVFQSYSESLGFLGVSLEEQLETVHRMRQGLAYGGSAYGQEADTRTISGALSYAPFGIVKFLFSPLPWEVRSWQQTLALPESILFFFLVFQAIRRVLKDLTVRATKIALPLSLIIVLTVAYALVSGNEGTAFRHRAQVVVIVLVFSAAGQLLNRKALTRARSTPDGTGTGRLEAITNRRSVRLNESSGGMPGMRLG